MAMELTMQVGQCVVHCKGNFKHATNMCTKM